MCWMRCYVALSVYEKPPPKSTCQNFIENQNPKDKQRNDMVRLWMTFILLLQSFSAPLSDKIGTVVEALN